MIGDLYQIPLASIQIHPALATVPTLMEVANKCLDPEFHHGDEKRKAKGAEAQESFAALVLDIKRRGIQEPLRVVLGKPTDDEQAQTYLLVDGRHRFEAARNLELAEVPCLVVTEAEIPDLIAGTIVGRRHFSKGAVAWLGVLMHPEVCESKKGNANFKTEKNPQKKGQKQIPKNGNSSTPEEKGSDSTNPAHQTGLEKGQELWTQGRVAAAFGVSESLVGQAAKLYREYQPTKFFEEVSFLIFSGTSLGGVAAGMGFAAAAAAAAENGKNLAAPTSNWTTAVKAGTGLFSRMATIDTWTAEDRDLFAEKLGNDMGRLPVNGLRTLELALAKAKSLWEPGALQQAGSPLATTGETPVLRESEGMQPNPVGGGENPPAGAPGSATPAAQETVAGGSDEASLSRLPVGAVLPMPEGGASKSVFDCPHCTAKGFNAKGLKAHLCPGLGNQRLSQGQYVAATA